MAKSILGTKAGDTLLGTAGSDKLIGYDGDDSFDFRLSGGKDTANGQGGRDTAIFAGSYWNYAISTEDTGNLKTTVVGQGENADLKWVETLRFDDAIYDVATGTVTPVLHIADASAVEGGKLVFHVSINGPVDHDVTFQAFTAAGLGTTGDGTQVNFGNATPGADFIGIPGNAQQTFTIPAGETGVDIEIQTKTDVVTEGSETMSLRLNSATVEGAVILPLGPGFSRATGTIDNKAPAQPVNVSYYVDPHGAVEGNELVFHFHRDGPTTSALDVQWNYVSTLAGGSATVGADFNDPLLHVVHFDVGSSDATVVFQTVDDGVHENGLGGAAGFESLVLQVTPGQAGISASVDTAAYKAAAEALGLTSLFGSIDGTQANIGHIYDPDYSGLLAL